MANRAILDKQMKGRACMSNMPTTDTLLCVIRKKCRECNANSIKLIDSCKSTDCPLYPYRSLKAMGIERKNGGQIRGQIGFSQSKGEIRFFESDGRRRRGA